ncbi:helix-turn-helix transcriptional regulator [Rhodohalobacter sp.]|uniref:helix-turn-helix transcriptional regulator n=1 Tax=Rhodohalobacter sp. TaxID=1974210 RepID=UPI003561DFB1
MIRSEKEYQKAIERFEEERKVMGRQRAHFEELGHAGEELERLMQPLVSFHNQLKEELEAYEDMKRGNLGTLYEFNNIGRWLIGVRIALGLSQKEFAKELGVSEAQVSRDENNEYHGITLDKAQRILETFNVRFKAEIEEPVSKSRKDKNPMLFA